MVSGTKLLNCSVEARGGRVPFHTPGLVFIVHECNLNDVDVSFSDDCKYVGPHLAKNVEQPGGRSKTKEAATLAGEECPCWASNASVIT